jgi:hypothetical protein
MGAGGGDQAIAAEYRPNPFYSRSFSQKSLGLDKISGHGFPARPGFQKSAPACSENPRLP